MKKMKRTKGYRMLFYRPAKDVFVSDLWCLQRDGLWYVYGLQADGIGVATSPDLTAFRYERLIFPGSWFGGDVFRWKGAHHMVYSHPGVEGNFINLAHSSDLLHWTDDPANPVLSFPDPRWYDGASYRDSLRQLSNCRDPTIIEDACTDEWAYMCFAADTGSGDPYRRACIGLARSRDLAHWECLPPLFAPGTSTLMEVPRVCRIGDRWFLAWLDAPWYGLRANEDTPRRPGHSSETFFHYAVADHPLGPYRFPENRTLFQGLFGPYVIDFARDGDAVLVLGCMFAQKGDRFDSMDRGGLIPAMPVRQAAGDPDQIEVLFPDRLRAHCKTQVPVTTSLRTNYPTEWREDLEMQGGRVTFRNASNRIVQITESTERDLVIDLQYRIERGRAGIVTRYADRCGCGVLVDAARRELQFVEVCPQFANAVIFKTLDRHEIMRPMSSEFLLSFIQSRDYYLVFVDGVFVAAFSFARREAGAVGLLLENATGDGTVLGVSVLAD